MGNCFRRTTPEPSDTISPPAPTSDSSSARSHSSGRGGSGRPRGPKVLTAADVKKATNNFCEARSLGKGNNGEVFRGRLDWAPAVEGAEGGDNVAVKRFGEANASEQWGTETLQLLTREHPNIVRLLGYCYSERVLVFPLYPNGSLLQALQSPQVHLSWEQRLVIAMDCACALASLHAGGVVHRNVKLANVLLDVHFRAHLSDFSLAKESQEGYTVTSVFKGDNHYLDPEYLQNSRVTEKSDVYAFGIILVEIMVGRPDVARDLRTRAEKGLLAKKLNSEIDKDIKYAYDESQAMLVLGLAAKCVSKASARRPDMSAVEQELKRITIIEEQESA